jgi:eukaryotic-like serine/threonine-protein kinase
MSESNPTPPNAAHNLLFGMIALQMNFISRDILIAAMRRWTFDKSKPLGQLLEEQGQLTTEQRHLLEQLVVEQQKAHENDPEKTVRVTPPDETIPYDSQYPVDNDVTSTFTIGPGKVPGQSSVVAADASRYQILRIHAKGALGEIFVALDQELHREVALKKIQGHLATDEANRGRFLREAEITGRLEHPGIVPVYGLGMYSDGRPCYAMRLIQGETLKDAISAFHASNPSQPSRNLLTRFVAVCNTVAYAHSRSILHRDLKPSNIMLGKYGETLVVDWGLAKAIGCAESAPTPAVDELTLMPHSSDSSVETQVGIMLGTPSYMSPEQALGRLDTMTQATDIYSLGATLYVILTGHTHVEGKDKLEVLERVLRGDWCPPSRVKPGLPPAFDAICHRALAMKPEDRYPTALALAADVEAWLADEPIRTWPEPWNLRFRRWMRRHRPLVTAAAAVVLVTTLALSVGVVLLTAANERERAARRLAEIQEGEARTQRDEVQHERDRARHHLYVSNIGLAQDEWENSNIAHVRELLDGVLPTPIEAKDQRGWEWYFLDRLCHGDVRTLRGHTRVVRAVAYSPDGAHVVSAAEDNLVKIWEVATGREVRTLRGHVEGVWCVAYRPDGAQILSGGQDGTICFWDAEGKIEPQVFPANVGYVNGVAYSPNGERIALAGRDGSVRVWDAEQKKELMVLKGHSGMAYAVSYSPDGSQLASAGQDGAVRLWDAHDGNLLRILKGHTARVIGVAYSPDGTQLASAGGDGFLRVWDVASGKAIRAVRAHTGEVLSVAYSPNGTRLASSGEDGTIHLWDSAGGAELRTCRGHTGVVLSVAFSRDGTRLVSAGGDGEVRIWDASDEGDLRTFLVPGGPVLQMSYSPDGTRFATACSDGSVRIWDVLTGMELRSLKGHRGAVLGLAYLRDGTRLASGGQDGVIRQWDPASGAVLAELMAAENEVSCIVYSPDGTHLAAGCSDGTVRVWDITHGGEPRFFKGHKKPVYSLAYTSDGSLLAASGDDGTARIWETDSGIEKVTLKGHVGGVPCVSFRPDGQRLATAGYDGTVRIWDLAGKQLFVLLGHTGWLAHVAYSPDGTRLASAGHDRTLRLWDAESGEALLVFKGLHGWGACTTYSSDGTGLASAGFDGMVRLADACPWTPEIQVEKEASGLAIGLLKQPLSRAEALECVRNHKGITATVRARAVELLAQDRKDQERFYQAAWSILGERGAMKSLYRLALTWSETANRLAPKNDRYLTALALAQYRLEQYADALRTVDSATALTPTKLAIQAMSHQQLGHHAEAQALLTRLRDLMEKPPNLRNAEALAFLAEAEEALRSRP